MRTKFEIINLKYRGRTVSDRLQEISTKRKARNNRVVQTDEPAFEPWDRAHFTYRSRQLPREQAFAEVNIRGPCTALKIFLVFLPLWFITEIMYAMDPECWILNKKTNKNITPRPSTILKVIAIMIRMQARQVKSSEVNPTSRPLRTSVNEARVHFDTNGPQAPLGSRYRNVPGIDVCEKILANFLITTEH